MRNSILPVVAAQLLMLTSAVPAAGTTKTEPPAPEPCPTTTLQDWLPCLTVQAAARLKAPFPVTIPPGLGVGDGALDPSALRRLRNSTVVATVPDGETTGPGGTIVMIVAPSRRIGRDSQLSYLDWTRYTELAHVGLCTEPSAGGTDHAQTMCQLLLTPATPRTNTLSGRVLLNAGMAEPLPQATRTGASGRKTTPRPPQKTSKPRPAPGSGSLFVVWLMIVVLALATAYAAVLGRKGRSQGILAKWRNRRHPDSSDGPQPGPPGNRPTDRQGAAGALPPPKISDHHVQGQEPTTQVVGARPLVKPKAPPSPPVNETVVGKAVTDHRDLAVVRTKMHPQGYVEVDRCLRRARWMDPHAPPPDPGEQVRIDAEAEGVDYLPAYPA